MGTRSLHSAASTIGRLSTASVGSVELRHSVAAQLRQVVDFDAWRFSLADPIAILPASSVGRDAALHHQQRSWYEVMEREPAFAGLMGPAQSAGVRVVSAAATSDLLTNQMWRDVLQPSGFGDAMFIGLSDRRSFWGHLCLFRAAGQPRFTIEDVELVRRLLGPVGLALRRSWVSDQDAPVLPGNGPGTLLLSAELAFRGATPFAAAWMRSQTPADGVEELPRIVYPLVARLDGRGCHGDREPRTRMRLGNGQWLVVSAARLEGGGAAEIAITVERAQLSDVVPMFVAASGLSEREGRLVELVLGGMSTAEIADALFISRYTVQDHLKSVFGKVGVSSRWELAGQLFGA